MSHWELARTFTSPQGTIRWDRFGEGPPVVLLHGTPSWSYLWRDVVPRLAQRYQVYVFDWPGYGTSAQAVGQNISWEEQPRRLVELLNHWRLQRPIIVAHDMSPVLALRAHFFEGIDMSALILADAAVIPPFVSGFSSYARENIGVFRGIPTHIAEAVIERHLASTVHQPMSATSMQAYMRPWRGDAGVSAYWRAVAAYDEDLARPVAERLHQLTLPTLALWGAEDQWEPVAKADELVEAVPGIERMLLPEAGHFAPEEIPIGFADAVADFIGSRRDQIVS